MSLALSPTGPRLALVLASTLCANSLAQRPDDFAELPRLAQNPAPPVATPPTPPGVNPPAQPGPPPPATPPAFRPPVESVPADAPTPVAPPPGTPAKDPAAPTTPPATPPKDLAAPPAVDQQAAPPPPAAPERSMLDDVALPSSTFAINLLKLMEKKKLLTREEADLLIRQADEETRIARAAAETAGFEGAKNYVFRAAEAKELPDLSTVDEGAVRVQHIPQFIKDQLREEIRRDLIASNKKDPWITPTKVPDWVTKFKIAGDVRLRYEGTYFPSGNDNTGAFPNFNSINTGNPFDVAGANFSPQLNVDEDRQRFRFRFRLAAGIDMGEKFTAGVRIATGENNSPTSPNQSFGAANQGQGGNFSKYAIWLDRVFIKYETSDDPDKMVTISGGRFDNPFFSTDLIYDDDLGFDGLAIQARYKIANSVKLFGTAGAFPIFNTDFNFSSNQPAKFDSTDKYLYGAQLGADFKITKNLTFKVAGAYYRFDGAEGELSTPYTPLSASDAGDTDNTRPAFAQKGNTYMALRRIIPNANNNFGTTNQFQYFGLGTAFQPLAITARLDYNGFEPFQISVTGEYIKNLGFDRERLNALGINNRGPSTPAGLPGSYDGGDTAWIVGIRGGAATMQKRGDWQLGFNYRHVESDAVIDGFNDSDFGLGGTNTKGFAVWASYAVSANTAFGLRWMSATQIAGPPLKSDLLQVDFSAKF